MYKLSIKESGKKAVKLLASKTGGDASRLSAPMEMHGTEREDFQIQLRDCSSAARVDFCCSTICVSRITASCSLQLVTCFFDLPHKPLRSIITAVSFRKALQRSQGNWL